MGKITRLSLLSSIAIAAGFGVLRLTARPASSASVLTGQSAFTDYTKEAPGVRRKITVADLPKPFATPSADNGPDVVPRPEGAWPKTLPGFKVDLYTSGLDWPREIRKAPNGDLFVAESRSGKVRIFAGVGQRRETGEKFGIRERVSSALMELPGIRSATTRNGCTWPTRTQLCGTPIRAATWRRRDRPETVIAKVPAGGGHWTRDLAFSPDGKKMFVSVGSASNVHDPDTHPAENHRANILEYTPEGKFVKVYAAGIRNPAGITIQPETGELWCRVNERDAAGRQPGTGLHHACEGRRFLRLAVVLHGRSSGSAPRRQASGAEGQGYRARRASSTAQRFAQLTFYEGKQFPSEYHGDLFAAEHGSWNKKARAGYEVIRVPLKNGGHRRIRGFRHRLCDRRWTGLGTSSGRGRRAGRIVICHRRRHQIDLARQLFQITDRISNEAGDRFAASG